MHSPFFLRFQFHRSGSNFLLVFKLFIKKLTLIRIKMEIQDNFQAIFSSRLNSTSRKFPLKRRLMPFSLFFFDCHQGVGRNFLIFRIYEDQSIKKEEESFNLNRNLNCSNNLFLVSHTLEITISNCENLTLH